jgi:hypothetical protein
MIFRTGEKEYSGRTAVEIVKKLASDANDFMMQIDSNMNEGILVRSFLRWSLKQLSDRLPLRELFISTRLDDELLARSYLSLRHDYGIGEFID